MKPPIHPYFSAKRRANGIKRERKRLLGLAVCVTGAVFVTGMFITREPSPSSPATASSPRFTCTVASITDGDTFRCSETGDDGKQIRIRLSGVAARERDGSCTSGHPCPAASAEAATEKLQSLALGEALSCQAVGATSGRVAAFCQRPDGVDLSCAMVESRTVEKWDKHWGGHSC